MWYEDWDDDGDSVTGGVALALDVADACRQDVALAALLENELEQLQRDRADRRLRRARRRGQAVGRRAQRDALERRRARRRRRAREPGAA